MLVWHIACAAHRDVYASGHCECQDLDPATLSEAFPRPSISNHRLGRRLFRSLLLRHADFTCHVSVPTCPSSLGLND